MRYKRGIVSFGSTVDKRFKEIYIWSFIIVAGVILLMLYTPIGGNFYDGNKQSFMEVQPGVDFSKKITNTPNFNSSSAGSDYMPSTSIQSNRLNTGNRTSVQSNNPNESFLQESSGAGFSGESTVSLNNYSSGVSSGNTFQTSPYSGRSSNSGESSGSGYSSVPLMSSNELTKISQNLGLADNNETLNKAGNETTANGASDPGGDPDGETVIPVGGNEIYLALLGFIYILVKTRFFNKKTT